ncbi:ABC transporter permease subunit, partial [Saccharothrix sp. MB29]|nr:ABC transporter permease subunit [Saccharothrix sp. MB29]
DPVNWLGDPDIKLYAVLVAAGWRLTGYIMLLYLAGLKAVDPALKEAAALDGANAWQTFFRVTFPVLKPVNVVVLVVTVIEGLRAFDIVYVINKGRNGLELLSVLVTDNIIGESSRIGWGSALHRHLPVPGVPRGGPGVIVKPARVALHVFLVLTCLATLAPLLWALYASLRTYDDTARNGYFSVAEGLTLENFGNAWTQAELPRYYLNTLVVTLPALVLVLLFSSMVAFGVSRFSFRFNIALLMLFTAGNLLPQQVVVTPLYRLYLLTPVPEWLSDSGLLLDSQFGLVLIHVAFQSGFCVFVLSNYMKTIPRELGEAARVDGAGVFRQYWQVILPLCRPALAALATLEFTWIYNDFLWALVLVQTGEKMPITSALQNLKGTFFVDNNLVAAGSLLVALPTLVVFFVLQRQFVGGLTLGSTKG